MVMNNPNKEVHFRGKLAKRAFSIISPRPLPPQKKRTIRTTMKEPVHRNKKNDKLLPPVLSQDVYLLVGRQAAT